MQIIFILNYYSDHINYFEKKIKKTILKNSLFLFLTVLSIILTIGNKVNGQASVTDFTKGELIYENPFSSKTHVSDWKMEGPAKLEFKENWKHMYSPDEKGHHVFWCPTEFPGSFIAEWELQNMEPDAGLCIVFFSALAIMEKIFSTLHYLKKMEFSNNTGKLNQNP